MRILVKYPTVDIFFEIIDLKAFAKFYISRN